VGVNQFYSAAALRELIGVSFAANKANMYFLAPKLIWISKRAVNPATLPAGHDVLGQFFLKGG